LSPKTNPSSPSKARKPRLNYRAGFRRDRRVVKKKGDTAAVGEVIGFIDKDGKPATAPLKSSGANQAVAPKAAPSPLRKLASCRRPNGSWPNAVLSRAGAGDRARRADFEGRRPPPHDACAGSGGPKSGIRQAAQASRRWPRGGSCANDAPAAHGGRAPVAATKRWRCLRPSMKLTWSSDGFAKGIRRVVPPEVRYELGFMSFFVKACVDALHQFPAVNAEIRENNIVYHKLLRIGVAIAAERIGRAGAAQRRAPELR